MPAAPTAGRLRRRLAAAASLAVTGLALAACNPVVVPAPAHPVDAAPINVDARNPYGWFQGGKQWLGDFPDPNVVRGDDGIYYAHSTPTGGRLLPTLASSDLKVWWTHNNWSTAGPPGARGYDVNTDPAIPLGIRQSGLSAWDKYNQNDSLTTLPSWGVPVTNAGPWITRDVWAPSVGKIGNRWVAYYAVKEHNQSDDPMGRYCISMAYGPSPLGPFTDVSGGGPVQCQPREWDPAGSIDPYLYHQRETGKNFLLWKAAGKVGSHESALLSVEVGADGRPIPGRPWVKLLETSRAHPWEGNTIENPGMINHNGMTYLFYSANGWWADGNGGSQYAMGYAVCPQGPVGPCARVQDGPLLASTGEMQGPGGSSPFHGPDGSLKLAYHAYTYGEARNPRPRRLHVGNIVEGEWFKLTFTGDV